MGCEQSVPVTGHSERFLLQTDALKSSQKQAKEDDNKILSPPMLDSDGNPTLEEIAARTSHSRFNIKIVLGTPETPIHVEYAYWTQRGYYPETPHKENQDRWSENLRLAGEPKDAMMAVYDGHGTDGHVCSQYAAKHLPLYVANNTRQWRVPNKKGGAAAAAVTRSRSLTAAEYEECCKKAFLECNNAMHKDKTVDDEHSGTTAITVHFHGDLLTVCNVGDSRAILGRVLSPKRNSAEEAMGEENGDHADSMSTHPHLGTVAIPLSRDQKPYRKDERNRVKQRGASIMSMGQMVGEDEMHEDWGDVVPGEVNIDEDPPRVWKRDKCYPGSAFTRSIGDSDSEVIGITAEPEMFTTILTADDKFLVLASDGILDFLTNQQIIDICARSDSPLMACQSLVESAYDQWITHKKRSDDITTIVCFLECDRSSDNDETLGDLVALA